MYNLVAQIQVGWSTTIFNNQTTHEPAKQTSSVHMTQLWDATLSPAHTFPPGVAGLGSSLIRHNEQEKRGASETGDWR